MSHDNPYAQGGQPPGYGGQPQQGLHGGYGQPQFAPQGFAGQPYLSGPYQPGGPVRPQLASWGQRVGAYLIDGLVALPAYLLLIPGYVMMFSSMETTTECGSGYCHSSATGTPSAISFLLIFLGAVVAFGIQVWNRWIKGGRGQSIGKKAVGISLLDEATGQPIGGGSAFVRDLAHILDGMVCYIGFLWPLWDDKRQTFADKMMSTVVIQGPPPGKTP